jgi:hypothetical protein
MLFVRNFRRNATRVARYASAASLALASASMWLYAQPRAQQSACKSESGALVPAIVELYTSEGCNSCPPADQWLSRMVASATPNVIPLAFHVDYWDYIGWKDAYAKAAYGERHSALVSANGSRTVYTPQVFVNGRDDRSWYQIATPNATTPARAKVSAEVEWSATGIRLRGIVLDAKETLRIRYAVTENGIQTAVKAGENKGETLKQDAIVREHAVTYVDAKGAFSVDVKTPASMKRERSQLHVIAETMRGDAVAAVTLKSCS